MSNIKPLSKQIAQYAIDGYIANAKSDEPDIIVISDDELMAAIPALSHNLLSACFDYLAEKKIIKAADTEKYGSGAIRLSLATAVDFVETD
jgi:hypothetical protein